MFTWIPSEEDAHPDPARHTRPYDPSHSRYRGRTSGSWGKTENGREAKDYAITRTGLKAFDQETGRWREMSGVVEKLLAEEQ